MTVIQRSGEDSKPTEWSSADAIDGAQDALDQAHDGIRQVAELLGETVERNDGDRATHSGALHSEWNRIFDCLTAVLSASKRDQAMEHLVQRIAFELPQASVRCARGRRELKAIYDHRLGWLAPSNSVRQSLVSLYTRSRAALGTAPTSLRWIEGHWVINLSSDHDHQVCFIWIKPKQHGHPTGHQNETSSVGSGQASSTDRVVEAIPQSRPLWLSQSAPVISAAFWSRPALATPSMVHVFGRRPWVTMAVTVVLVSLVFAWPVQYPIRCAAVIRPVQQRVVASPFEATLLKTLVRPGDQVQAGQHLLELDGRPLRLELESIAAEVQRAEKDETVALAGGDVAGAQQAALQQRQLSRRRELLNDRLGKLSIVSPIDGVVIGGELDHFVGVPLKLGQTLIEIAPVEQMIAELEIPAFEIGYVKSGAPARVRVAAVGGASHRGELRDLAPAAEVRDDENIFVGRVRLDNSDGNLRPGMKADAMTYGPTRPFIWSFVRGGWERLVWWMGY